MSAPTKFDKRMTAAELRALAEAVRRIGETSSRSAVSTLHLKQEIATRLERIAGELAPLKSRTGVR